MNWRRRRRVETAAKLSDPDFVVLELLCSLPKDELRVYFQGALGAARDPDRGKAASDEDDHFFLVAMEAAAKLRPDLMVHFENITQLLVAWALHDNELKRQALL